MNDIVLGFFRCPEKRILLDRSGRVSIHKLNNVSECNDIGFPQCDNSTCYNSDISTGNNGQSFESHVICTSYCDNEELCKGVFQCSSNHLIFLSQFCDGIVDCFDGSDEITNQPGFKCSKCILPQINLYDSLAHCSDNSDFCFANCHSCFQCFDSRLLISPEQVCDGVRDCHDLSDECLCEEYFDSEMCMSMFEDRNFQCFDNQKPEKMQIVLNKIEFYSNEKIEYIFQYCDTKFSSLILATTCDGRSECRDFSDECECPNPPRFCNDSCRTYFPMGDRYCDGVEDHAWQYINKTSCPKGFDELFCPKRFRCRAAGKVSIDVQKVCDGTADCDDDSDEQDCPASSNIQKTFSSDTEMIANVAIKSAFWIIGFVVIIRNTYVIITSIALLKNEQALDIMSFHQVIILNIAFADFIMGIYLLAIAFYDVSFSGIYGAVDHEWRSSLKCSIIGSLAVLSSETSCFLMVILTAFRTRNIFQALKSLSFSLWPWKLLIGCAWLLSFILSIVPMLNQTSQYFLHSFSYSSIFSNGTFDATDLKHFACRYAVLHNATIAFAGNEFQSVKEFINNSSSDKISVNFFGYYGETSVCMPRFYVAYGERSWEYTFSIITVNFVSFLFIAIGYFIIYKQFSGASASPRNYGTNKEVAKMQRRIARIIATDFCCWIPICVVAYVRLGVEFSDIVYQISAALLLPINSALNPILFTSLPDKLMKMCRHKRQMSGGDTVH